MLFDPMGRYTLGMIDLDGVDDEDIEDRCTNYFKLKEKEHRQFAKNNPLCIDDITKDKRDICRF